MLIEFWVKWMGVWGSTEPRFESTLADAKCESIDVGTILERSKEKLQGWGAS